MPEDRIPVPGIRRFSQRCTAPNGVHQPMTLFRTCVMDSSKLRAGIRRKSPLVRRSVRGSRGSAGCLLPELNDSLALHQHDRAVHTGKMIVQQKMRSVVIPLPQILRS